MISFPIHLLKSLFNEINIVYSEEIENRLNIYANLLIEWNKKINLTAITDPESVVIKHFADSLLLFKAKEIPKNSTLIDVGTGAGFPGLVLKAVRPDIEVTLLDSLNKRLMFLEEVLKETSLSANTVHIRAEEGSRKKEYREQFDFAVARAVARLNVLSEYCLPFVKEGGSFIALKGPAAEEEIKEAENAISLLGGKTESVSEFSLENEKRVIVTVKKISQTNPKYPRISAKIQKQPL